VGGMITAPILLLLVLPAVYLLVYRPRRNRRVVLAEEGHSVTFD